MIKLEILKFRVKQVVINIIERRTKEINNQLRQLDDNCPKVVKMSFQNDKLKLDNILTEICVKLDEEFENIKHKENGK